MASYDEVMKRAEKSYGKPLPIKPPAPPKEPKPPTAPATSGVRTAVLKRGEKPESTFKERRRSEQTLAPEMRPSDKPKPKYFQGGSRGSK